MLDFNEKNFIASFFNNAGYVLNFSDSTFDTFTLDSVGIPIQSKYRLSKGKSLNEFIKNETDDKILKLANDLVNYIEFGNASLPEGKENLYPKLLQLLSQHTEAVTFSTKLASEVKDRFDDQFIEQQMELMLSLLEISPTDVVGKAKELLESCFKHILDESGESYSQGTPISNLRKQVFSILNLDVKTNVSAKNNDDVKKILSSFNSIVDGLSSLRNDKGDGHGKGKNFKELPKRYAQLAMNASLTVVHFTWDTFRDKQKKPN
ncbi:abortive infection family protein [Enterococcus rivorum]|uniref:abortive infection family protein n=1 Tax=Enterococcus rivorum TaxID=762845 RepID=UPI000AF0697D|nr:abortive infection family protein [Enterococcus rivorum]MBP2098627.1 hypothetical protein [Enterococcus rivorum]